MQSNNTPDNQLDKTLSPTEERVRTFAKYLGLVQLALVPIMVLIGDFAVRGADLFGNSFLKMKYPKAEVESSHFWKALAVSLAASLAYYAFRIWSDPRRSREWIHPILAVSLTGSLSFLLFFFYYYTLSLAIGFIFLALILIFTLFFWWRAKAMK